MADVLVDTDVFVDHMRGAQAFTVGEEEVAYSVVTRCELFSGRDGRESDINILLAPFAELGVDRAVAERAGRIRRHRDIRVPDALIAATALEHRLTLVTRNVRHFGAVPGLTVRTPQQPNGQTG